MVLFRFSHSPAQKHSHRWIANVMIVTVCLIAGCSQTVFISRWAAQPPPIGGERGAVWDNVLSKVGDRNLMVGFLNDSDYLYLSFITDDRMLQHQILTRGFTVWFDREGGNEKRFGFQYPLAATIPGIPGDRRNRPPGEWKPDESTMERPTFDESQIEIFGPMPEAHSRMNILAMIDMAVNIGFDNGTMIYSVKIPFRDRGANPFAIGTGAGSKIGVGIETSGRAGRGGGDRPGGGGMMRPGGSRGGMSGGGGGGGQRPSGGQMDPLDLWATVQLATK